MNVRAVAGALLRALFDSVIWESLSTEAITVGAAVKLSGVAAAVVAVAVALSVTGVLLGENAATVVPAGMPGPATPMPTVIVLDAAASVTIGEPAVVEAAACVGLGMKLPLTTIPASSFVIA